MESYKGLKTLQWLSAHRTFLDILNNRLKAILTPQVSTTTCKQLLFIRIANHASKNWCVFLTHSYQFLLSIENLLINAFGILFFLYHLWNYLLCSCLLHLLGILFYFLSHFLYQLLVLNKLLRTVKKGLYLTRYFFFIILVKN